jgi:hypothetical protein
MIDAVDNAAGSTPAKVGEDLITLPSLYTNGFIISLNNADINITLLLDGQPVARMSFSYTIAKTLEAKLGEVIDKLQNATGQKIMTTEEVDAALRKILSDGV